MSYILGRDLLSRWNLEPFELVEYVKMGLVPHDQAGRPRLPFNLERDLTKLKKGQKNLERLRLMEFASDHSGDVFMDLVHKGVEERKEIDDLVPKPEASLQNAWKSYSLPVSEEQAKKEIEILVDSYYRVENLSEFERRLGEQHENERSVRPQQDILPCKPGTAWEKIRITLVSDEMVRIRTPLGERRYTYHQMGLADGRKGDRPKVLWAFLVSLAKNQGRIENWQHEKYNLPKTSQRLDRHLQESFGIHESIYKGTFKKQKAYETRIMFSDETQVVRSQDSESQAEVSRKQEIEEMFKEEQRKYQQ